MATIEEIAKLIVRVDSRVSGPQSEADLLAGEAKLGVTFPPSFREYLLRLGSVSFGGLEFYGLTKHNDFHLASIEDVGVPNCVWCTLDARRSDGLPRELVMLLNNNGDEYLCIDTSRALPGQENPIVLWDNIDRQISDEYRVSFVDFLFEELSTFAQEQEDT